MSTHPGVASVVDHIQMRDQAYILEYVDSVSINIAAEISIDGHRLFIQRPLIDIEAPF